MFARYLVSSAVIASACAGIARADEANRPKSELLEELVASSAEWKANEASFRSMRQGRSSGEDSIQEFAEFVAILRRKMLESCQSFRASGGTPDKLGFDCAVPEHGRGKPEAAATASASVKTRGEQSATVDAALAQSMAEFDKLLDVKREQVRAEMAMQQQSGQLQLPRGVEREGKGHQGGQNSAETSAGSAPSKNVRSPVPVADPGAGPGRVQTAALKAGAPGAIGGSDDDVVARQLREAAEKEKDPILKEKLWNEYRKYKSP